MTVHRPIPSEVDPTALADLVADCLRLPPSVQPRPVTEPRTIDLSEQPAVAIPAQARRLVAELPDYGS